MASANTRKRRAPTEKAPIVAKRSRHAAPVKATASKTPKPGLHNEIPSQRLRVYVFGDETAGELGLSSDEPTEILRPRLNPKLDGVVGLATGGMHAAALTSDGEVLTWGVNDHYALGRNTAWNADENEDIELNPHETTPTNIARDDIPADVKFVQIAACDSASFFLANNGTVYGCGTFRDHAGILGFSLDKSAKLTKIQQTPRLIPGLQNITSLCAGSDFVLALDNRGQVHAWGDGQSFQLGRRFSSRASPLSMLIPSTISLPKSIKIVSIHTGNFHAFAVDSKGDTWAWGMNNGGQTGIAETAGQDKAAVVLPQKVPALVGRHMKMLCGGQHHSVGVTSDGECLVWGRMDSAQVGIPTSDLPIDDPSKVMRNESGRPAILLEPTKLPISDCVQAAAGSDHSFAVTKEGRAWSWGFNDGGQCGQGNDEDVNPAALIDSKAIRGEKIVWAGAGGRYGMLGVTLESDTKVNGETS